MTFVDVYDNFLPIEEHQKLLALAASPQFPWFFNDSTLSEEDRAGQESMHDFQFVHSIFAGHRQNSPFYDAFAPMIEKLAIKALVRIKLNCTTWMPTQELMGWHKDYEIVGPTSSIYYLNTNNGKTVYEDGTSVDSVANRLVTFPAHTKHSGKTATDVKQRLVVNFLYFT
jgi:hypothetical protein